MKKRLDLAEQWEGEANLLKQRFNQDFWVPDLDFCAMALDGEGRPLDGIGSNPGHCLGLGIFTPEKAEKRGRSSDGSGYVQRLGHSYPQQRFPRL